MIGDNMRRVTKWVVRAACAAVLAAPGVASAGPANLVANDGFETGSLASWTGSGALVRSYAEGPHTGDYAALFGLGYLAPISQTLATVAGQSYTFSFYVASDGDMPNEFQAFFDGTKVYDVVNAPASGYTLGSFGVVASTASTTITFKGRDDDGFLALDDVSVTVPEPATLALLAGGVAVLGALRRRQS